VRDAAGPVLEAGDVALAVIGAIQEAHPSAEVVDRGAYLRVRVAGRCSLRREAVERRLGRPFRLPADLELIMPAFAGRLELSEEEAVWTLD
jgi:toluene monooxygenase system protein D